MPPVIGPGSWELSSEVVPTFDSSGHCAASVRAQVRLDVRAGGLPVGGRGIDGETVRKPYGVLPDLRVGGSARADVLRNFERDVEPSGGVGCFGCRFRRERRIEVELVAPGRRRPRDAFFVDDRVVADGDDVRAQGPAAGDRHREQGGVAVRSISPAGARDEAQGAAFLIPFIFVHRGSRDAPVDPV